MQETGELFQEPTLFIKTPNILKTARYYFNCDQLQGMPLEDNMRFWKKNLI